jgi:diguanylate cyclase (GGDEF)-like protein
MAAETSPPARGPLLDRRARWMVGRVASALALMALCFALVPALRLSVPDAPGTWRIGAILLLGLGVVGCGLLSSLRGRGRWEQVAFYLFIILFLDAIGQMTALKGFPVWPLLLLLVGVLAVAESLSVAVGAALVVALLVSADAYKRRPEEPWGVALGYAAGAVALAVTINRALAAEKRRMSATLAELARLHHGITQLDEGEPGVTGRFNTATLTLRQVSDEGRRALHVDRAQELTETVSRLTSLAQRATRAHAALYFEVDREREMAYLRAAEGPPTLTRDAVVPLGTDPFTFVLERNQPFYATDFRRLLWSLPYYRGEVRIGTLLAVPVRAGDVTTGLLIVDRLEGQALSDDEPAIAALVAELISDAVQRTRASLGREEIGTEFKAVYAVSRQLAALVEPAGVRRLLLRSARDLTPIEAGAVLMTDEAQSRYTLEDGYGWCKEFEGREVALDEKTWAAWVLRSAEDAVLLESVGERRERMPVFVLDEGLGRAASLLAVPLRARARTLGALVLTAERGAFDAAAFRVLGILANQAAAALATIQLLDRIKDLAIRDALTGLYNRRAFDDLLQQALAQQDRQGGSLSLLLFDIDHFKRLNDTYGHPTGDAALKNVAQVLTRHLRKGDQAARYGGEEFVVILPGTEIQGALLLAERIRKALETHRFVFEGARVSCTASFGVATWSRGAGSAEQLLTATDKALYAAKEGGRNRVVQADPLVPAANAPSTSA